MPKPISPSFKLLSLPKMRKEITNAAKLANKAKSPFNRRGIPKANKPAQIGSTTKNWRNLSGIYAAPKIRPRKLPKKFIGQATNTPLARESTASKDTLETIPQEPSLASILFSPKNTRKNTRKR